MIPCMERGKTKYNCEAEIVGGDFVKSRGGKVVRVSLVPAASTSGIIEKIVENYC